MVASALVFSAWSLPISSAAHNVSDTSSFCGSIIVRSGKAWKHRVKALPATRMDNAEEKVIWIWTRSKEVLTTAVERGWDTFVFSEEDKHLAYDWASIATFRSLFISDGIVIDHENKQIGLIAEVSSSRELQDISRMAGHTDNIIVSCLDWQIIPAENLVAVFQGSGTSTFAVAKTLYDAQVFLEALEKGVDGVVVHTDDTQLIFELKAFLNRKSQSSNVIKLSVATITQVKVLGLGDRVCVDLCSLLYPGEGLLVGSFSRGLFLVHSECLESSYIATRPFRVNAGPVHAYVAIPDGKTSYLAELKSGQEVIVVDSSGRQRRVSVGRVKIESRPLILVKAKIESSEMEECSIILQNAETVSLVCHSQERQAKQLAIPVSTVKVGDKVLLSLQASARHTGLPIQEFIVER